MPILWIQPRSIGRAEWDAHLWCQKVSTGAVQGSRTRPRTQCSAGRSMGVPTSVDPGVRTPILPSLPKRKGRVYQVVSAGAASVGAASE